MGGAAGPHLSLTARKHISKKVPLQTLSARLSHSSAAWKLLLGAFELLGNHQRTWYPALRAMRHVYPRMLQRRNAWSSTCFFHWHCCSPVLLLKET